MAEMTLDEAQLEIQTAIAEMDDELNKVFNEFDGGDEIKVFNKEQFETAAHRLMELSYIKGRLIGLTRAQMFLNETFDITRTADKAEL